MHTQFLALTAALGILGTLAASTPVRAGDIQGDAYSCEELWVLRNQIFKDARYCFKTEKAITYFGNGGCVFTNQDDVPLSKIDEVIIRDAKASEARQGC